MMIITKNLDIINRGIGQYQYSQSEYDPYGNKILTENQKKRNKYASMSIEDLQKVYDARFETELNEVMKIKKSSNCR
jgi:hypothetical protein